MNPSTTEIPRPGPRVAKELVKSNGFLLARTGLGFKMKAMALFEGEGFDHYDYGLLAILAEGAPETQATIAAALNVDPSRLVALLDSLEQRGLVVRQRDPQDRRRHVVSITAEGKRNLARLRELTKQLEDEYFSPLDADERRALRELLQRVAFHNDPRCAFALDKSIQAASAPGAASTSG
jgi:MarR family transcriptional regulator, lower aerobic nicotinate degradation pathway regulator